MKNTLIATVTLASLWSASAFASAVAVAQPITYFMDSQKIFEQTKEGKAMVASLAEERDRLIGQIQGWQQEMQAELQMFEKQRALMSEDAIKEKEEMLTKKNNDYTRQTKALEEDWKALGQRRQMALFEKFKKVGTEVCKNIGGSALMDVNTPGVFYVSEEQDITTKIVAEADNQYSKELLLAAKEKENTKVAQATAPAKSA